METNENVEFLPWNQLETPDWQEVDGKAIDRIAKEFDGLLSAEKLEKMRSLPSKFETREEFEKDCVRATGSLPEPGLEGFTDKLLTEPAKISEKDYIREQVNLHERLHQASDIGFKQKQPHALNEGVTQALTDKIMGTKNVGLLDEKGDVSHFYPEATKLAENLITEAGAPAVEKLYVQNDGTDLKTALGGDAQYEARMEEFKKLDASDVEKLQRRKQG